MSSKIATTRCVLRAQQCARQSPCRVFQHRQLSSTPRLNTDGVFRALTEQRMQVPWIEAFRKQQREGTAKSQGETPVPAKPDLTPKKMSDSYHSVILPLAQEPSLLDTYLNATGHIRLGTIFMDLDALSGVIAYKHTGEGVSTVTAAFDRITINHPLTEICDLELSGHVSYAAGGSSMEISLQVAKVPKDGQQVRQEDIMITCQCTMVATDPATKRPVKIAPVRTDTEEERQMYALGAKNSKIRKERSQRSLLKTAPNDEESDLIHAMWQRQLRYHDPNDPLRKPDNVFFMDTTRLNTAAIMQPQYRNRHHFMIFGGFLLKQTIPYPWAAFCISPPR
ncbi:hypothetical protein NQ176_g1564 [Zarea fungicola]|uniref:Uncharacterized protein n=1 Tax=Zarea fungicola TaxID=93591 RepID=A0ACC1NTQ6_9HYPO|nr:hypothetical protein NQ176_g1564 [Lecanicillium fungicola]